MSEVITIPKTTVLTLNILAKDILENKYTVSDFCPITRALARAGRPDLYDSGRLRKKEIQNSLADVSNLSYLILTTTVIGMYCTKDNEDYCIQDKCVPRLPIEDCTFTITFNE